MNGLNHKLRCSCGRETDDVHNQVDKSDLVTPRLRQASLRVFSSVDTYRALGNVHWAFPSALEIQSGRIRSLPHLHAKA